MKRFCRIFRVLFSLPLSVYSAATGRPLTPAEASAVVQAVEDEICDSGNYRDFRQLPENMGTPQHWKSRVHIYIDPESGSAGATMKLDPLNNTVQVIKW